jgi:hypothetical protein
MHIHQLQASYQQEQDRILLRLNTRTGEEFRLWLTRRMTLVVLPHLTQMSQRMGSTSADAVSHDGAQAGDLAHFKQQESLAQADFQTPYSDTTQLPAGDAPLLVTQVRFTQVGNGTLRLAFDEKLADVEPTRSFEVTLGLSIVHALLHLMEQVLKAADWAIAAAPAPSKPDTTALDAFASAERPVFLN